MRSSLLSAGLLAALAVSALAQEAQTYLYDANGRLIAATTARPTSGAYVSYALDDADNRTARSAWATTGPTVAGKLLSGENLVPTQAITNGSYTLTLQTSGDLVVTGPWGSFSTAAQAQGARCMPGWRPTAISSSAM